MIDINRNNYEEYFLDFIEGNLTSSDENLLMLFLERNPDLKEELDLFEDEVIPADEIRFENKGKLKKSGILSEITNNNFDDLCVARLEGDLEDDAVKEFDSLIDNNPQKQKEYTLYSLTKIWPEENIVYPYKNNLKRRSRLGVGLRKHYIPLSVAASVILLLAVYLFIPKQSNINNNLDLAELKKESAYNKAAVDEKNMKERDEIEKIKLINVSISNKSNILTKQIHKVKIQNYNQENQHVLNELHQLAYLSPTEIKLKPIKDNISAIKIAEIKEEENEDKKENYMSVKTFLAVTFNKVVLKKDNKKNLELFDLAQAGVEGINKLTGSRMKLERAYDKNGNPTKAEFNSRLIAFSTPTKKE